MIFMTIEKATNKQRYGIGVAFIFFMLLVGTNNAWASVKSPTYAINDNDYNLTAGSNVVFNTQLDATNVSSVYNAFFRIVTTDGVLNATVWVNQTFCNNFNATVLGHSVVRCTAQITPTILQGDINVTLKNQDASRYLIVKGIEFVATYEELQPAGIDTSQLLRSSDYQSNVTQQATNLSNVNTTLNNAIISTNTTAFNAIQSTNTTAYNAIVSVNQTQTTYFNTLSTAITNIPTNVWNFATRTLTEIRQSIIRAT